MMKISIYRYWMGLLLLSLMHACSDLEPEYTDIYDRFARLLHDNRSLVDDAPLRLVADAFLIGRRLVTDPFHN